MAETTDEKREKRLAVLQEKARTRQSGVKAAEELLKGGGSSQEIAAVLDESNAAADAIEVPKD